MQTDIEIARQARLQPIQTSADRLGIPAEAVSPYGRFIGKVSDPVPLRADDKGHLHVEEG